MQLMANLISLKIFAYSFGKIKGTHNQLYCLVDNPSLDKTFFHLNIETGKEKVTQVIVRFLLH